MSQPAKPGFKSTEFALTVLVLIGATVLAALGVLDPTAWAAAAGLSSGGYSLGRGRAKQAL